MTTIESPRSLDSAAVSGLRLRLRGDVFVPGDAEYDAARHVHNLTVDRRPAVIARVQDASDIIRALNFGRVHGLEIAVRSGGHSISGKSVNDGGLVIDMSAMKRLDIDPATRLAWAQPGVTAGEITSAAQAYGLALPLGDASSVGLGGITLGGGIGFLARKHGLTIDNLVSIELVTADGRIVNASETENPELFWGLRGGGGNFGVVTGFQYRLPEVGMVIGGGIFLPLTADVIRGYVKIASEAPDELPCIAQAMYAPPAPFVPADKVGTPVWAILTTYAGDLADGAKVVDQFRALGEPIADLMGPMPYAAMYQLTEEATTPLRNTVRSFFTDTVEDGLLELFLKYSAEQPSPMSFSQIRVLGGAMARVDRDATAFSHRDAKYMVSFIGMWTDEADDAANRDWAARYWEALQAYSSHRVYSNFLADEGEARVREAYSAATFTRLAALKAEFDPENVFCGNQNVAPAREAQAA
jgi:FAD/FMN-containing dehydrogenase